MLSPSLVSSNTVICLDQLLYEKSDPAYAAVPLVRSITGAVLHTVKDSNTFTRYGAISPHDHGVDNAFDDTPNDLPPDELDDRY